MVIRIITCHDVYNYGASLQAFALQNYLIRMKHDVRIIDYKPSYQKAYKFCTSVSPESPNYKLFRKYPFLTWVRACKNYIYSRKTIGRKRSFDIFTRNYLNLTVRYDSYTKLVASPPPADVYIAGSDQIWNSMLPNGIDPAFYLQFGSLKVKRMSYAASFAYSKVFGGYDCLVRSLLSNIDALSVRETSGLTTLNNLGIKGGTRVLDPVFLVSREEWEEKLLIKKLPSKVQGRYILCYDLKNSLGIKERVSALSKEYHLPIVSLNDRYIKKYADVNINNAGPLDFLKLISEADFVVTDSFHATAFCVIFKKIFWTYFNNEKNARIKDFLALVNLSDRLNCFSNSVEIDWSETTSSLSREIVQSKSFILNQIENH